MNNPFADQPEDQNPYASPADPISMMAASGEFNLIGQRIVGPSPIVLPEICVRCGENAEHGKRYKKKITWSPSWVYLLILINLIVLVIVNMIVKKTAKVEYSLCEPCAGTRWMKLMIAWMAWGLLVVCLCMAASLESAALGIFCFVLFIACIVASVIASAPIKAKDYQKPVFYLGGAKQPFFDAMALRETTGEQAVLAEESY
ncbi:MAG: hypothetical protein ACKVH8_22925 [Pirellulales bacterium]|jgi:hypothetical protein